MSGSIHFIVVWLKVFYAPAMLNRRNCLIWVDLFRSDRRRMSHHIMQRHNNIKVNSVIHSDFTRWHNRDLYDNRGEFMRILNGSLLLSIFETLSRKIQLYFFGWALFFSWLSVNSEMLLVNKLKLCDMATCGTMCAIDHAVRSDRAAVNINIWPCLRVVSGTKYTSFIDKYNTIQQTYRVIGWAW